MKRAKKHQLKLGEGLVFPQVRALDHQEEVRELLSRVRAEAHVAVGGRLDGGGLDRGREEGVLGVGRTSVHQPVQ